jgi:hypothetical protein
MMTSCCNSFFASNVLLLCIFFLSSTAMSKPVQTRNLLTEDNMRLVTDNVMGGVSRGEVKWSDQDEVQCLSLTGDVSTENNGGFIQAAMDIDSNDAESLTIEDGVILKVRGNGERYNVHLRTSNLWFPWQAYRATFETDENWQTITIAFKNFIPYKTSSQLKPEKIKRIGIVAIGRDFKADVCISELKFYKAKPDKE